MEARQGMSETNSEKEMKEMKSAEKDHLKFDHLLNRSNDSDMNRQEFGIYHAYGNVPIESYHSEPTCIMPYCDNPEHFNHITVFKVTYELRPE
jgi:hypothetical protein